MNNYIEAGFIDGAWDGKIYAIPNNLPEYRVYIVPLPNFDITKQNINKLTKPDIAVYVKVMECEGKAIYWFSKIEKADEA